MSRFLIYGLRDPRTMEIRYVGKSTSGLRRPKMHARPASIDKDKNTYKGKWLSRLRSLSLTPEIIVLEYCRTHRELSSAEKHWIAIGRTAIGKRFTNATEGGDGAVGLRLSDATRAKMRARKRELFRDPLFREKMATAARERSADPEMRRKVSATMKRLWSDEDFRKTSSRRIAEGARKQESRRKAKTSQEHLWTTEEYRSRQTALITEAMRRPEIREKIRIGQREMRSHPTYRANLSTKVSLLWQDPSYRERVLASKRAALLRRVPKMRINLLP